MLGNIYKASFLGKRFKKTIKMAKIYGIISAKGGVGKTTSAINLAAALNSFDQDTMVVDANLSTPNVGLHLGAPIVPVTLNHVLSGSANIPDAIYEHYSGLKILPSSLSTKDLKKIRHENLSKITKQLKNFSEHIVLDSSAGLGREALAAINAADEIILVTQAEMPSVTDALKSVKLAEQLNKYVRGFIITKYQGRKTEMSIANIKDMLELPLLGVIPEDKNIQKALALKNAIIYTHPRSKASRAYKKIAKRILGLKREKSLYQRILDKFGL